MYTFTQDCDSQAHLKQQLSRPNITVLLCILDRLDIWLVYSIIAGNSEIDRWWDKSDQCENLAVWGWLYILYKMPRTKSANLFMYWSKDNAFLYKERHALA